jgi:hypothetical protein
MATRSRTLAKGEVDYPTSDGRPMAETDLHRDRMFDLITTLQDHFAPENEQLRRELEALRRQRSGGN